MFNEQKIRYRTANNSQNTDGYTTEGTLPVEVETQHDESGSADNEAQQVDDNQDGNEAEDENTYKLIKLQIDQR